MNEISKSPSDFLMVCLSPDTEGFFKTSVLTLGSIHNAANLRPEIQLALDNQMSKGSTVTILKMYTHHQIQGNLQHTNVKTHKPH